MAAMARKATLLLSSMVEPAPANNTVNDSAEMAGRGVASPSFRGFVGAIAANSGFSCLSGFGFRLCLQHPVTAGLIDPGRR